MHKQFPRLGDIKDGCRRIFREFSAVHVQYCETFAIDHSQNMRPPSGAAPHLIVSTPVENNSNRRTVIFLIVKHEVEAGSTQHITGSALAPAPAGSAFVPAPGALLHPVPDDRAVGGQRILADLRPPTFVFRFIALPEGVRIQLPNDGARHDVVTQAVGQDLLTAESDIDGRQYTPR